MCDATPSDTATVAIGGEDDAGADVATMDQCSICFDPIDAAEKPTHRLECSHRFHQACITPWLERGGTCPLCRAPLPAPPPVLTHDDEEAVRGAVALAPPRDVDDARALRMQVYDRLTLFYVIIWIILARPAIVLWSSFSSCTRTRLSALAHAMVGGLLVADLLADAVAMGWHNPLPVVNLALFMTQIATWTRCMVMS